MPFKPEFGKKKPSGLLIALGGGKPSDEDEENSEGGEGVSEEACMHFKRLATVLGVRLSEAECREGAEAFRDLDQALGEPDAADEEEKGAAPEKE
jgi:hypothetical protein